MYVNYFLLINTHHVVRLLQESKLYCCEVQHNMNAYVICTGVVWQAIPAAIALFGMLRTE